ncbi:MAG: Ig-like domain-containing protein [Planctomycetota bacterium]
MRGPKLAPLSAALAVLVTLAGCGGGGGGSDAPFSGSWFLLRTDTGKFCGDIVEVGVPLSFSTSGGDVTMTAPLAVLTGSVSGSTATIAGRVVLFDPGLGRYVVYSDFLLERTDEAIVGTATVRESSDPSGLPAVCEGVAQLKAVPEMRLVSFAHDGATNVALDQPLVLAFSRDVDPASVNPDTFSVTGGSAGPTFEVAAVDGPRVALLPQLPSFPDFADVGLSPGTTYVLDLADHLDAESIRSVEGARVVTTTPRLFTTTSGLTFIEPRRPLVHMNGPSGSPPGLGDEQGCLDNAGTSLFTPPGIQSGSGPSATLLCLVNEGVPRVIPELCVPVHDDRNVGTPSATPDMIDLPAIQVRLNEPVNPAQVGAYDAGLMLGTNVQLWHVGTTAATPILVTPANQVQTLRPVVAQSSATTTVILSPAAPVPPGTYLVVVRGLTDLPGNPLVTGDDPSPFVGGYTAIDAGLGGFVPIAYRYYFRTP